MVRSQHIGRLVTWIALLLLLCTAYLLSGCEVPPPPPPPAQPQQATPASEQPATEAAATPIPEPTSITLDQTLQFDAGGLSLNYPQSWSTQNMSSSLLLASDEAALTSQTISNSIVILIDSMPLDTTQEYTESVDIATIFEASTSAPRNAGYTISETVAISVSTYAGLQADLSTEGGAGRLIVATGPSQIVRILGQATAEVWEQEQRVFDALVASIRFTEPVPAATPAPAIQAGQPELTRQGPPGFLVRLGSHEGPLDNRFVSARGLDVGPDGTVYLAESSRGIWVFAPDGTLNRTFGEDILRTGAYDVALGPDGDVFVADYAHNMIVRFKPDGTFVTSWGASGEGAGQFGSQSPQRIAVGADGTVYALDSHIDVASDQTTTSIVLFNGENGTFIERIPITAGITPNDLAVDSVGAIYVADAANRGVFQLDRNGTVVARFGDDIKAEGITAGAIDIDRQGNLYIATWGEGILGLSPDGNLIASGGSIAESGTLPLPGQFSLPNGITVAPGDAVWVSDNSGEYSAITALRLFATSDISGSQATAIRPIAEGGYLRQWAYTATASSSYGDDYGPDGATGPPDVEGCQDSTNAWAPVTPDTLETLELTYQNPVFATQVTIYQNHQPGFVSQIELQDERGTWTSVYTGEPALQSVCPYKMEVAFEPTLYRVVGVRVTVDQRQDANWSEIDAVEIVGVP